MTLGRRAFAHWDDGWKVTAGCYRVPAGSNSRALPLSRRIGMGRPRLPLNRNSVSWPGSDSEIRSKTNACRPKGGRKKGQLHMSDAVTSVSVEIAGSEITFETGKMAKQASGAVVVRQGDTLVLNTATVGNLRDVDFLPLTVDVEERMYAAGKIPGSFFKREGRSGEKGTLTARMIDRPIRPLFPKGWHFETQLVSIPLSIDHVHPYDILAMNGASAALMISEVPLPTPVGAVRIGKIEGNFVVNPPEESLLEETDLDLVVAGTEDAILMVEAGANEIPEAEILDALDIAHDAIKKLCAAQRELAEKAGKEKLVIEAPQVDADLLAQIQGSHGAQLDEATQVEDKLDRQDATKAVEESVLEQYSGDPEADTYAEFRQRAQLAFDKLEKQIIRERIAVHKKRPDGRAEREIRQITIEAGLLPRTHGSALFTRGQTQALSVAALGTLKEEMRLDTLGLETKKYYWHHYNFPPFSVGEAGFMRGPKRRDIGHGALAERALVPMIPSIEEFPYTIRVVSDILESNGSSSMASVCGSSLSLMDAGVPIKAPVAGIAMGLIKEGDDYIVLTDIAGVEDHLGDMDFKVAGTSEGITALQMDIKITGVTFDILRDALSQAKEARMDILGQMAQVIDAPRTELSAYAPRIITLQIDPSKIGMLIGKGGETIRGLSEEFESQIDVNDDGQVLVYSANGELGEKLAERITSMLKDVEVGDEFPNAKVVKTTTFGAFVELSKGTDGLLHISNVSPGQRVDTVEDVLNKGDEISVRVVEVDRERGRIGLRLANDPEIEGKSVEELAAVGGGGNGGGPRGPRRDREGGRDRDRGPRGSGRPRHGAGRDRD
jgi:polyribonucleotide nucleotidyltransferase